MTLNAISGGFASRGKTNDTREFYVSQILGTTLVGKRPREEGEVVIFLFSEVEMEHVVCPHEDALVITAEIDGYDVK